MKYGLIDGDYDLEGVLEEVKILKKLLDDDGIIVIENVFDSKLKEMLLYIGAELDPDNITLRIIK